ncbi:HepT-like ribonuclease domain-containing protein [Algoriphagus chordae]|uniref:Uncharacterized protein with HEPN domain n=1 Tax=Algoriphagus chordae TaxID=237019 RepID=A0A2W7QZ15_9BACT|nr:HepT-like ribonuclease domain-containing protein [Algoriphagus chordae]PZX48927.1 uncharacterized protein with HEPN domain [Algoriphagus chordae]
MDRKIKSFLFDIVTCIDEIHDFFDGQEIDLDSLLGDKKTVRAVERNLEIIGEATRRILSSSPEISISNTKEIIGARNIIAHEYGTISYEIVIKIIKKHPPVLKKEAQLLLEDQ